MTVFHLQGPRLWTRCGVWIPELPEGEICWDPGPDDRFPGITSCLDCIAGRRANRPYLHSAEAMRMWTISDHPSDHPDRYVVREWVAGRTGHSPSPHVRVALTLDEARRLVPRGLQRFTGGSTDPVFLETWL